MQTHCTLDVPFVFTLHCKTMYWQFLTNNFMIQVLTESAKIGPIR